MMQIVAVCKSRYKTQAACRISNVIAKAESEKRYIFIFRLIDRREKLNSIGQSARKHHNCCWARNDELLMIDVT